MTTIKETIERLQKEHADKLAALPSDIRTIVDREVKIHTMATRMSDMLKTIPDQTEAMRKASEFVFSDIVEGVQFNKQQKASAQ